ncbi:hypothetical protein SAMN00790413_04744 [Deinococcus hopiensis KR-140]|uniref:Uncharacterized protein n=1 Tax=Deinococcus hopiensis KR-140 TaxID=695939 RepID=A0A1W1UM29_9DEIO|nr:hypothetical protein SAMN00790413_04744 [Deinococcus hopiensis KR-140]
MQAFNLNSLDIRQSQLNPSLQVIAPPIHPTTLPTLPITSPIIYPPYPYPRPTLPLTL